MKSRTTWLTATASLAVMGLVAVYLLVRSETSVISQESYQIGGVTDQQLADVATLRVFFAHQSVGQNIIDAIPAIYSASPGGAPDIVVGEEPQSSSGGFIQHVLVGTNGDPIGKIREFDRIMRGGLAANLDVAALKLCYIDFSSATDVDAVFESYSSTMAALQRDYPEVSFLYFTAPITTDRGVVKRVKARLGLDDSLSPMDNVARESFNSKVRDRYEGTGQLFDIAAIQSTSEGTRSLKSYDGAAYYAMEDEFASDPGHLNPDGAIVIGRAFLEAVAAATDSQSTT